MLLVTFYWRRKLDIHEDKLDSVEVACGQLFATMYSAR